MKKYISTISLSFLLLFTIIFFSACGEGKPKNISDQHYQYALKAIEIADDYLDYSCSASDAYDRLETLMEREEDLPQTEFDDLSHLKNSLVESSVVMLSSSLLSADYYTKEDKSNEASAAYNRVLEHRNKLAEDIGEDKR